MISSSMNKQYNNRIALSAGVILLLYLVLTPLIYIQPGELLTSKSSRSVNTSGSTASAQNRVSYITMVVTENLMLADTVIYHIVSRNQQENRQILNLIISLVIFLSGYGILIHNSSYIRRFTNQHINVLARSMGGHAPPHLYR